MTELKTVPVLAGIVLLFTSLKLSNTNSQDSIHAPCPFIDTVDLTGYKQFPNESYSYEGLIIPPKLWGVGVSEYTSDDLSVRIPTEPHIRGCICKLRPCVKFCCPRTARFNGTFCEAFEGNNRSTTLMNITTSRGELREVDLAEKFYFQYGRPCSAMYHLMPHINSYDDSFSLFENGTLLRWEDQRYFSKDEFCLTSFSDAYITDVILPMNCFETATSPSMALFYGCTMLFSVPFMISTIVVYLTIPELKTLHGKSLCCYLFGLCCGYLILSTFLLIPMENVSQLTCEALGFFAYFSFMSSFFWLSVISFDLFCKFCGGRRHDNEKKLFKLYSIYAWGFASIFLCLTYAAQQSSAVPWEWKPAIGGQEWCWLDVNYGWSAAIYFFGPILIIICFNIIMFVLTALKIHGVQKQMSRMMESNDSRKNFRTEKDGFGIFLRLFIVMGVTWSMEIISYLAGEKSSFSKMLYITDIVNCIQGILIFTLFVWKKNVKQHFTKRYMSSSRRERSCKTQNTGLLVASIDIELMKRTTVKLSDKL